MSGIVECKEKPRGAYTCKGAFHSGRDLPGAIQRLVYDVMFPDNEKPAYPGVEDFVATRYFRSNLML